MEQRPFTQADIDARNGLENARHHQEREREDAETRIQRDAITAYLENELLPQLNVWFYNQEERLFTFVSKPELLEDRYPGISRNGNELEWPLADKIKVMIEDYTDAEFAVQYNTVDPDLIAIYIVRQRPSRVDVAVNPDGTDTL